MRLIDADALDVLTIIGGRMNGKAEFAKAVNEMIQNAPTIDAVPVIRCKDCKHADWYHLDGMDLCYCNDNGMAGYTENDFCSHAEREEQ